MLLSSLAEFVLKCCALQADETTEVLKIPRKYHPSLIGQGGKSVIRLEENYNVKITFPRDSGHEEDSKGKDHASKGDEVTVKGGKKGVASAKAELLEVRLSPTCIRVAS